VVYWGQVFTFDIADYREKVKIQDLTLSSMKDAGIFTKFIIKTASDY